MMKTKRFMLALLLATSVYAIPFSAFHSPSSLGIMAQNKQFTLEDLNFGGNNYRNMMPESKYYTWWGDQLVRYDVEECFLVDKNKGTENVLLDTTMVNDIISSYGQDLGKVHHMYNVTFPEAKKTLVYALGQIQAGGIARTGQSAAAQVIIISVPIIIFVLSQSRILETMASSGIKD